jgi:hypothetical protein
MIGQHPELAGLPEMKLFCYSTVGELDASLPRYWIERGVKHRSPGLVRAIAQFEFGDQCAASVESARQWLRERSHWSGADVFDLVMERLHPRATVEKSPDTTVTDDALARMALAYPRARYLHLTRHPITTLRSMVAHWNRTVPGAPMEGLPMSGIASWVETQCRILSLAARVPGKSYLRVRAEDVLNDMRPRLKAIAEWAGVRTDEAAITAMTHPETSPFASTGEAGTGITGGNDASFLSHPVPRPVEVLRTVEQPVDWVGHPELWQLALEVANQLGYP